ncbi:hypothetical protein [Chamaesiphon sp.]|uniref:hypothetical protein n=1 Tax=Chamaesiphon sp. TaxID=2814140 RepID=UPI003592F4C6
MLRDAGGSQSVVDQLVGVGVSLWLHRRLFPWEHRCLFLLPSSLGVANRLVELTVASCYTVLVDVSGITDRQRGIILYSYTNLSLLASPIDNL